LTQAELAARVGVAKNTVTRIEIGNRRPSFDLLERLAKTLKVSLAELVEPPAQR
jgi:transcriptional regulator with XRE-family HTH domain